MVKVVVVRHGESEFNGTSRFCGWIDAGLTPRGLDQARAIGDLIKDHPLTSGVEFELLATSRLRRAISTANVILEDLDRMDMDVVKTWRLNERHYGALQGRIKNEVLQECGKDLFMHYRRAIDGRPPPADVESKWYGDTLKIAHRDKDCVAPLAESLLDVASRLGPFWESALVPALRAGTNVLVVTHGSVIRALLRQLFDLEDAQVEGLNVPNGIPILVDFDEALKAVRWRYLDPERAQVESEKVRTDGLVPN